MSETRSPRTTPGRDDGDGGTAGALAVASPEGDAPLADGSDELSDDAAAVTPPLWKRLGPLFWLCAAWVAILVLTALLADWLPLDDPEFSDFAATSQGPSFDHWMGTDALGRDVLSRVIYGTRVSIVVGVFSVAIGLVIGGLLGMLAGYFRRRTETLVMTFADAVLSFPALVLLMALTTFLGQNLRNIVIAIGVVTIPVFIRLARANTLAFAQREFVQAARATGARHRRVVLRELLPNVLMPLMALSLIVVAVAIVAEGSLSFLGLSVPPTTPTWGNIIAAGRQEIQDSPHIVFFPSAVMFVTVLAFNLAGDRLRELLDVKEGAL